MRLVIKLTLVALKLQQGSISLQAEGVACSHLCPAVRCQMLCFALLVDSQYHNSGLPELSCCRKYLKAVQCAAAGVPKLTTDVQRHALLAAMAKKTGGPP